MLSSQHLLPLTAFRLEPQRDKAYKDCAQAHLHSSKESEERASGALKTSLRGKSLFSATRALRELILSAPDAYLPSQSQPKKQYQEYHSGKW